MVARGGFGLITASNFRAAGKHAGVFGGERDGALGYAEGSLLSGCLVHLRSPTTTD